jgi:hypothetical protein
MEKPIIVLKSLLLPVLEKDNNFNNLILENTFWEKFSTYFSSFETDAKPTYDILYALQLSENEKVLDKLPQLYHQFLKEMAELYALGELEKVDKNMIENAKFQEYVSFLKTMKNVITKVERERIKKEIPTAYEKLTFEINDHEIQNVIKKQSREGLKEKMKQWDKELESNKPKFSNHSSNQEKSKVISLNWLKYAVAACVVFGIGIVIWQNNTTEIPNNNNTISNTENDTTKTKKPSIIEEPIETIAYQEQIIQSKVQLPNDLGFAPSKNDKTIKIIFKDGLNNIKKLEKLVFQNHSQKVALENQLNQLKSNLEKYEFNGKELIIYTNKKPFISILSVDNKSYFIKKDQKYFYLYFSKIPLAFKEVKSIEIIEKLEKISFENE